MCRRNSARVKLIAIIITIALGLLSCAGGLKSVLEPPVEEPGRDTGAGPAPETGKKSITESVEKPRARSTDETLKEESPAKASSPEAPPGEALFEEALDFRGEESRAAGAMDREAPSTLSVTAMRSAPSVSGLKAGFADDNKQYNYFVKFLHEYADKVDHFDLNVEERIILTIRDREGKSIPNARVTVFGKNKPLCTGRTYADGAFYFFPSEYGRTLTEYRVSIEHNQQTEELILNRFGRRKVEVSFNQSRPQFQSVPLDILFILDTTGSMGEEIQRLKTTIEIINLNLTSLSSKPEVRFGMVLYKDQGDEYVTRTVPLTSDLERFQQALDPVDASGGGDTPEDLQSALEAAMTRIEWNKRGIRLSFIITDAPPHLDYSVGYTYIQAAADARQQGIKIYSVGTGGLDLMGEYILRQLSQYTGAKYIFLTYGERGESEGGSPGSVSHHTGANYQTDKLETIIIRFAKEELQHLTDQPLEEIEEYFEARRIGEEEKEETLGTLFGMALSQLIDYSSFRIAEATPTAVLPINPALPELKLVSEYFTEQLIFTLGRNEDLQEIFRMVERKDLQQVLEEMELQLSGLVEDTQAAQVGALLGAEVPVTGRLYRKAKSYQLFIKLLRVETGEILSITKAVLDLNLGL